MGDALRKGALMKACMKEFMKQRFLIAAATQIAIYAYLLIYRVTLT
jgi:hypothetical protein